MATYRQVQTSFWQDGFVLGLTPEEKYFYIYLMTNSKTTQCGIYELPKRVIEMETGYNRDTVDKLLNRFEEYEKIVYSEKTQELMLPNWLKYNKINSPKVKLCIVKELETVKNKEFVIDFYKLCKQYQYELDTVSIDLGEEEEKEEEQEREEEKELKNSSPSATFDSFWKIYPRKAAKKDAESAFKALIRTKIPLSDIMKATTNYATSCKGTEQEYIKLPATFLRKERWKDYLEVSPSAPQTKSKGGYSGKKVIPTVDSKDHESKPISAEELEELKKLARSLDEGGNEHGQD
ncbi:MAG TPA: replication protein [Candidatus Paenibacillus intestinavium]|nr:replication protein [Candidatus Paenibacillus intestinavium]